MHMHGGANALMSHHLEHTHSGCRAERRSYHQPLSSPYYSSFWSIYISLWNEALVIQKHFYH